MSVVVPAYNEQSRITVMLEEAVEYLDRMFGRPGLLSVPLPLAAGGGAAGRAPEVHTHGSRPSSRGSVGSTNVSPHRHAHMLNKPKDETSGYEILIVNDGSRDETVNVALNFARKKGLHDVIRVVTLEKNRGKGGAVTHGLRHVRGEYAVFADADGASRFSDLGKLLEGLEEIVDGSHRGVVVGSRAHMIDSEAVVKVCSMYWQVDSLPSSHIYPSIHLHCSPPQPLPPVPNSHHCPLSSP